MRQIVNGLLYDTDNSTLICKDPPSHNALYRANSTKDNYFQVSWGSKPIIALTYAQAIEFAADNMSIDDVMAHFRVDEA